jgi:hypothetical protein
VIAPTLLVLAAGAGSRYGGLKVADPVGHDGETMMDYSIYDAHRAGFGKILFVIRREIEKPFRATVNERFGKCLSVDYVFQDLHDIPYEFHVPPFRRKPWGTTHAILTAAPSIHGPFGVINADDFYGAESYRALAHHLQSGTTDYAMVGFILRNTLPDMGSVARGVCEIDSDHLLTRIVEMKDIEREGGHARSVDSEGVETRLHGDEIVSMNMWGFTPSVFELLREHFINFLRLNGTDSMAECFIPNTVNEMLIAGQAHVKVLRCIDAWFGVTYREDHPRAIESVRHLIEAGYYPKRLWA